MSGQPDIQSILAALAAQQRPTSTPASTVQPHAQAAPSLPQGFPGVVPTPTPPATIPAFPLPQPTNSGSLDLSAIKPVNTGSVSITDAIAKAKGIAAERGLSYETSRGSTNAARDDPRLAGRSSYRPRSRSRSRSPPRRDNFRDNYNPYRDERRDDSRRGGYGRDRSRSPPAHGRNTFSPPRGYAGRERSPQDNSETIQIASSLVGLVIGRQGENLRRIEQDTGTRIQFLTGPEAGAPERQCRITGNPRARADAKREINRIIEENGGSGVKDATGRGGRKQAASQQPPPLREGENNLQIMVPDRTVGLIIGRGGETIRDLQERSGCHVNIVGENKSVNGLRPVNLIGSPQAAAKAKELIMEIVDSDTRTMAQGGGRDIQRSGGFDAHGADQFGGAGNKVNDTIMVPSDSVGMIIGKGGETIKEMQNQTGCKINVSQASGADIEREIGLVGTRQAIEDAKRAIWEKVDTVRQKNGAAAGGSRGGRDNDNSNFNDRYSQQQPYGQQPAAQAMAHMGQAGVPGAAGSDPNAVAAAAAAAGDPYAAYGGYQNYVAMWYAMAQQQAAQAQGAGQNDQQQRPPGA